MKDFELLDEQGYPTEDWLEFLRKWTPETGCAYQHIFDSLLHFGLWMPERCLRVKKPYKGYQKFEIHTGGWSGNEDVVDAILSNFLLRHLFGYYKWEIGGHHYFRMKR